MPKKRVVDEHRRDPHDGTQLRNVLTPNGKTRVGVQSFVATPDGEHHAWLFMRPGEKEAHAQDNCQAVRTARKKARLETKTASQLEPLHVGSVGLKIGTPLGIGSDREKTQKALSYESSVQRILLRNEMLKPPG